MTIKISVARFREAIRCYEGYCLDCGEFTRETTEPDANGYDCPVCEGRKVVGAENLLFTPGIEITEESQPGRILRDAIKKSPPVKTPKMANIRVKNGDLKPVPYSRRFTEHGFNWFVHRDTPGGYWTLSNWETGYRAGCYRTQGECRERIKALIPEDINLIKGAVSLHGGANPPVKKETKPCLRSK